MGCFRKDIRTITVEVPQLRSAECSKILLDAASKVDGIISAKPDIEKHTVDITYNALKLAIKNIEFVIAGAGFDANTTPATPEAKAALPAGCR
jgi:copper chaperone CopZ